MLPGAPKMDECRCIYGFGTDLLVAVMTSDLKQLKKIYFLFTAQARLKSRKRRRDSRGVSSTSSSDEETEGAVPDNSSQSAAAGKEFLNQSTDGGDKPDAKGSGSTSPVRTKTDDDKTMNAGHVSEELSANVGDGDRTNRSQEKVNSNKNGDTQKLFSEPKVTQKDLKLGADNIGSVFISKLSASQSKPLTVPASGLARVKPPAEEEISNSSSNSEGEPLFLPPPPHGDVVSWGKGTLRLFLLSGFSSH